MTSPVFRYFLPHESNNHKAKALHFSSLIFYLSILLILQFSLNIVLKTSPGVLGIASDISIDRLLFLTNQQREENGLAPLKINKQLSEAAEEKAKDMIESNYWSHNNPNGKSPWDFIIGSDYKYLYAGENLAKDFANSDGVVSAWMKSPTHRENILQDKYEEIGFAVVNGRLSGEETTLVVQMFGKRDEAPRGDVSIASSINNPEIVVGNVQSQMVSSIPKIDIFRLSKSFSFFIALFLSILIALDILYIYKKKVVRISAHNLSHLFFLISLLAVILLTTKGVIA